MPFIRIVRNWQIPMKTTHTVRLEVREGFFRDRLELYVDDRPVVVAHAHYMRLTDAIPFEIDGRTLELRWLWGSLSGNPVSIVIVYKDRILAQYGSDRAADDTLFT